jgi:ribonuclease-3
MPVWYFGVGKANRQHSPYPVRSFPDMFSLRIPEEVVPTSPRKDMIQCRVLVKRSEKDNHAFREFNHSIDLVAALAFEDIQASLEYVFKEQALLCEALTHRSYSQTQPQEASPHNERLEFLGDAVLGLVVSESIVSIFPGCTEGELSKIKAGLISRSTLAKAANRLRLGQWLRLGRGEEVTKGREKSSLLANALEAIIGAVYLDGGLDAVKAFIQKVLAAEFSALQNGAVSSVGWDAKSQLQEWVHKQSGTSPQYRLVQESGPDHQKVFTVTVEVQGNIMGKGKGRTKKEAEQHAAAEAIKQTNPEVSGNPRHPKPRNQHD